MHTGVHSGGTRNHPAFPHANGFNDVWRALPGDEFVLPPSPANGWPARPVGLVTFADLTPATGARTTRFCRPLQRRSSACRSTTHGKPALRSPLHANAAASTASRFNVRDDSRSALMRDGMRVIFRERAGQEFASAARRANHLTENAQEEPAAQRFSSSSPEACA